MRRNLETRSKNHSAGAEDQGEFERDYQQWYTESYTVISQLVPARLTEFEALYYGDLRRKDINSMTYTIQDWLMGRRAEPDFLMERKPFDDFGIVVMRFYTQFQILISVERRFESTLFDIKQLVQADLLDSEVESARELCKNGFLRAAGVVAGVVLESHLLQVCKNHSITIRKRNPTIADYNESLKNGNVIDIPIWRFIQRLGDLRNLCGHKKEREPTDDDTSEMIDGVERITKTLY